MSIDPNKFSDDALDTPGTQGHDDANTPDTQGYANDDFAAVEPDVDEAAHVGDRPMAAEGKEMVSDGRAPRAGWGPNLRSQSLCLFSLRGGCSRALAAGGR